MCKFNQIIKTLGGLCVIAFIPLVILGIWVDKIPLLKVMGTDLLLIVLIYFLDRATEDYC